MHTRSSFRRAQLSVVIGLCIAAAMLRAQAAPTVFWASDPVLPDETIVILGGGFAAGSTVRMGRAVDAPATTPADAASIEVGDWTVVEPLQRSDHSLKCVVPVRWEPGIFACHVISGEASGPVMVNAPDPWWMQGDRGESCSPGGWLRVFGKSLCFRGYAGLADSPQAQGLLRSETGREVSLEPAKATCYALSFDLPAALEPGTYTVFVHNGFGGNAAWRQAGVIRIESPTPWPSTVFDVKKLGLQAALAQAAENGGGVVYFPRGRYRCGAESQEPIAVPDYTTLKGEGMHLVNLYWPDMDEPPLALVTGKHFAIEDLSIYCQNYFRGVIRVNPGSDGFRMRRVRVRADPFYMFTDREKGQGFRSRVLKCKLSETGHALLLQRATNFEVTDCDMFIGNLGIWLQDGKNGLIARNKSFGNGPFALLGFDRLIVEDNVLPGGELCGKGCIWIDEGNGTYATNLYCARNRISNAPFGDRELFTFDSANRIYDGKVTQVDGVDLTLAADPSPNVKAPRPPWPGAAMVIFAGRGLGQYRRVVSVDGRRWQVDRPWDIPPDDTSLITIVPLRNHILFVDNELADGGATQAYAVAMDTIFAGNTFTRTAGAGVGGGYCVSLCCQLLDNRIIEGNAWGGGSSAFRIVGGRGTGESPGALATIFRRNEIHNNGALYLQHVAADVLVERCRVSDADRGSKIDANTTQLLLRHNVFQNVPKPLTGEGIRTATIVPPP